MKTIKTLIIGLLLFVSMISQVSADSYTERLRLINDPETKTYIKYMDELTSYMRNKVSNFSEVKKELFYFRIGGKLQDLKTELITQMKNEKVDTRNIQIYSDVLDYMILYCFERSGSNLASAEKDTYLYDLLSEKINQIEIPEAYEECIEGKQVDYNGKTYMTRCFTNEVYGKGKITENTKTIQDDRINVIGFIYNGGNGKIDFLRGVNVTMSISETPGEMNGKTDCKITTKGGVPNKSTGELNIGSSGCKLEIGKTYYANFISEQSNNNYTIKLSDLELDYLAENKLGIEDFNSCEEAVASGFTHYDGRKIVCKTAHKGQDIRNVFINPDEVHVYTFSRDNKTHNTTISQGGEKRISGSIIPGDVEGDALIDTWNKGLCTFGPALEGAVTIGEESYYCNIPLEFDKYYISVITFQSTQDIYNIGF